MPAELTTLGDSAVQCWRARDTPTEARLAAVASLLSNVESAVDASGLFPQLAQAIGEVVRQFEYGAVALLMGMTPLAADASRRILEIVHYTVFLHHGLVKGGSVTVGDWHNGFPVYSFTQPIHAYFATRAAEQAGPFAETFTIALFKNLSAFVHANPKHWGIGRDGLEVKPEPAEIAAGESQLVDVAKSVVYLVFCELRDLAVDEVEDFYGKEWAAVQAALGLP